MLEVGTICTCSLNMSFSKIRLGDLFYWCLPSSLVKSNFTAGDDSSINSASALKSTAQENAAPQLLSCEVVYAFLLGSHMFLNF